ncbi:MAG: hypothetical protein Q9218_003640 [Villophora microphyllina]
MSHHAFFMDRGCLLLNTEGKAGFENVATHLEIRSLCNDDDTREELQGTLLGASGLAFDPFVPDWRIEADCRINGKHRQALSRPLWNDESVDWSILKQWLQKCEYEHVGNCVTSYQQEDDDTDAPESRDQDQVTADSFKAPVMLINVDTLALEQYAEITGYVTLSWVWRDTRIERSKIFGDDGIHLNMVYVPLTFRDAIEATRMLGERYLWIDALCIDQSDAVGLTEQISQMDLIYGRASLTIVAVHGSNGAAGLCGMRPRSSDHVRGRNFELVNGCIALKSAHKYEDIMNDNVWRQRAWTFQEEQLSKRCLIFTEHEIFYRCKIWVGRETTIPPSSGFLESISTIKSNNMSLEMWDDSFSNEDWSFKHYAHLVQRTPGRGLLPSWAWAEWEGKKMYSYWISNMSQEQLSSEEATTTATVYGFRSSEQTITVVDPPVVYMYDEDDNFTTLVLKSSTCRLLVRPNTPDETYERWDSMLGLEKGDAIDHPLFMTQGQRFEGPNPHGVCLSTGVAPSVDDTNEKERISFPVILDINEDARERPVWKEFVLLGWWRAPDETGMTWRHVVCLVIDCKDNGEAERSGFAIFGEDVWVAAEKKVEYVILV